MRGLVLEIQKFSINDGPGIRTTVFLKGCPLNCLWCHNPESISPFPEIAYDEQKCRLCGNCMSECPECHRLIAGKHIFIRKKSCAGKLPFCPSGALARLGAWRSAGEVLETVLLDKPYYDRSGGGLTLSGGEPMLQYEFTRALLLAAKAGGLHCCLDTSGFADFEKYNSLLGCADIFLYDIKEIDDARHREYTGVSNKRILENLRLLDAAGGKTILRCPIIPGHNDRSEHFEAIAALANRLKNILQIDIMPFHPWGRSKARRIGRDYKLGGLSAVKEDLADKWVRQLAVLTKIPVSR
ncbi:MAG: glycyl-radical enzyme activating protein [Opitutaceae bacterium]|jgi:pyruvate formate lyase activating enzyme|nr:glycyl-radical enzyme activating protein [Opitutaceae bacterium]